MKNDQLRFRFFLPRPQLARSDAGFTLVEVVVAIAILALLVGSIFRANSDSVRNIHRADTIAGADVLAQSLIAKVGNEILLQEGETSGDAGDGLQWRLRIQRYGNAADQTQWPVAAYIVSAVVALHESGGTQRVALTTIRLSAKEAPR
jgi:prepilin-type N-terminal cleavage/methylation domain-containing protein